MSAPVAPSIPVLNMSVMAFVCTAHANLFFKNVQTCTVGQLHGYGLVASEWPTQGWCLELKLGLKHLFWWRIAG